VIVAVLIIGGGGIMAHARWRRRKLVERLRSEWGVPQPVRRPAAIDAAESWRELDEASDQAAGLDDRTWLDLDLDAVVSSIDRTHTGLGQQALYRRLRSTLSWNAADGIEQLVGRFGADASLRESAGVVLHMAGPSLGRGLWIITRPALIRVRWWYWSFPVLALGMLFSLMTIPFYPPALIAVLVLLVLNLLARMATAWQVPGLLAPMRQMGALIATAERLVGAVETDQGEAGGIRTGIKSLAPLRRIARWVSRDPFSSGELVAGVWEYLNLMFILDANALVLSAHELRRQAPVVSRVAQWVGDVDVALCVASLRAEPRDWCIPVRTGGRNAEVAGVWHPLVESPVANDAELYPGRGVIVTGANMSGKSTYLRSIGIAAVLARSLNTCPATSWRGALFGVRSLIGRADDLSAGKSYYQVEADGVVAMLEHAAGNEPTLFILDELLRGTNTIERLAAGEAVLRGLLAPRSSGNPHAVIVATHDGELVAMLEGLYAPWHFRETLDGEALRFDYRRPRDRLDPRLTAAGDPGPEIHVGPDPESTSHGSYQRVRIHQVVPRRGHPRRRHVDRLLDSAQVARTPGAMAQYRTHRFQRPAPRIVQPVQGRSTRMARWSADLAGTCARRCARLSTRSRPLLTHPVS